MPETDMKVGSLVVRAEKVRENSLGGLWRIDTINGPDVTHHRDDPPTRPGACSICGDTGIKFLPLDRTERVRNNSVDIGPCDCIIGKKGVILFETRGRNEESYFWFEDQGE